MDQYTAASYDASKRLTLKYSTSFSLSSRLFDRSIRKHIYAVYGLVRAADEVVDTYEGSDKKQILDELETQVYESIKNKYSTNPLVHSFALTVGQFGIDRNLIKPFFDSMRTDINKIKYTKSEYEQYIYGSAEVIGLMCLKIFAYRDKAAYKQLETGARALGSAYQKVNFLRDMSADYNELGRIYFPGCNFESFDTEAKNRIVSDIKKDLSIAQDSIRQLPSSCRKAVLTSYRYYKLLLEKLDRASVDEIKNNRIRIPNTKKTCVLLKTLLLPNPRNS